MTIWNADARLSQRRMIWTMRRAADARFTASWIALAITGLSVLAFGLIVAALPSDPDQYLRAIGVASIGMGLFGTIITATAFRRRERWAWIALWYYPVFWTAHLVGNLPPGQDHVHQVVFIALSLLGLLLTTSDFFPSAGGFFKPPVR